MVTDIKGILKRLEITETGHYDNHFYVIQLKDSNDYARMYTKLDKNAVNTEYPEFTKNSSDATVRVVNYFELDYENVTYTIFLFANFDTGQYYVKIGEI